MNDICLAFLILAIPIGGGIWLWGRWCGIKRFDNEMIKTGVLPPYNPPGIPVSELDALERAEGKRDE